MIAKIQIPDGLELGKIYKGSIYLTANAEGHFRKYNISNKKSVKKHFKRLSHGKISWTKDDVRLSIHIDRHEQGIEPQAAIAKDAVEATEIDFSTDDE